MGNRYNNTNELCRCVQCGIILHNMEIILLINDKICLTQNPICNFYPYQIFNKQNNAGNRMSNENWNWIYTEID